MTAGTALGAVSAENKGFTVGALNNSGVSLVSTDLNFVKSAEALTGIVGALMNRAGNAVVVFLFHGKKASEKIELSAGVKEPQSRNPILLFHPKSRICKGIMCSLHIIPHIFLQIFHLSSY